MHFLPDVWIECEDCHGQRYTPETLSVLYHGHSINDVLNLPCGDALRLFEAQPKITRILQTLCDVGLDYVTLGQAAPTLSGGEAQRVKLAAELARPDTGRTLYLLDEPTTGLHFDDIAKLLNVLQRLVDLGNTVLVIEHNMDVIKTADWLIDMGPEAGSEGGLVVCQGTPEEVVAHAKRASKPGRRKSTPDHEVKYRSYTGEFLAPVLDAGPYEVRQAYDPEEHARILLESQQAKIEPAPHTQATWESDGRKWHLVDPKDRTGHPVKWEKECLRQVIEHIESVDRFAPTNFSHPSIVEISGLFNEDLDDAGSGRLSRKQHFHQKHWFLHAFSSEALWLKLKFRVPLGTFKKQELLDGFDLPTLSQMNIVGVYSSEPRVRVASNDKFQEIELRLFKVSEVTSSFFQSFLQTAIHAYCGPESDGTVIAKSLKSGGGTELETKKPAADALQPWRVLGRKWHTLRKGFPEGQQPEWSLDLVEKAIELLEGIAGAETCQFDAADAITILPESQRAHWAKLRTKQTDALQLQIFGEAEHTDLDRLKQCAPNATIEITPDQRTCITIPVVSSEELRSRKLKSYLKNHYERTFDIA
jgi:excinuclease ABC subunit A